MSAFSRFVGFSVVAGIWLLAVASFASERGRTVPDLCPSFAGAYAFPGHEGLASVCDQSAWHGGWVPWPGPGGFYVSAARPHELRIRQIGCERVILEVPLGDLSQKPELDTRRSREISIELTPARRRTAEWGANTLFWRQHFIPSGFRLPFTRSYMEVRLTLHDDRSLEYSLRHEERWRIKEEIRCRWPRVEAGGETAPPPPGPTSPANHSSGR